MKAKMRLIYISALTLLLCVAVVGQSQSMTSSTTMGAGFTTDLEGEGESNESYVYTAFEMCPLSMEVVDPDDTLWYPDTLSPEERFRLDSMGCGFINTGCIAFNIKLALESSNWRTDVSPPVSEPSPNYFVLWATAISRWHGGYENVDFWPSTAFADTDRTVCAVDSVPHYDKITADRFYNRSIDIPPYLSPPMDSTGLNLYPGKSFRLLLLLQGPESATTSPVDSTTIILHVVAEPMGGW